MAVDFGNGPIAASTKFHPDFGAMTTAPMGGGNNAAIPSDTSVGVLNDHANAVAAFATNGSPSPLVALLGVALLLALLKFLGEHKGTAIDPADLHVGAYNVLTITVIAIIGIASAKLLFNWAHLPGITPLVNFV